MRASAILAGPLLMAAAVLAAPAGDATAESPTEAIGRLQAQGYTVNIDRVGSAALEDCVVTSVRNPQTVTKWVRVERNGGRHHGDHDEDRGRDRDFDLVEVVVSKSISVSLNCAG
ncbi:hypothetical protein BH09ACT7_BH09ACT7_51660 [soil metagenome]